MLSPGSCSRCNSALPAGSDSGLCLTCRRAAVVGAPVRQFAIGATLALPHPIPDRHPNETPTRDPGADGDFSPDPDRLRPPAPPGYELVRWLGGGGMGTVYL